MGKKALGWDWDCYLCHSWGPNNVTHGQVMKISQLLREEDINPWIDEINLKQYLSEDLVRGLRKSACVVVFLTQSYLDRVEDSHTNAGKEFRMAELKGGRKFIPVILEKELLDPRSYAGTRVGLCIQDIMYVDFSSEENLAANFGLFCERIREMSSLPRSPTRYDTDEEEDEPINPSETNLDNRTSSDSSLDLMENRDFVHSENLEVITSMIQKRTAVDYGRVKMMLVGRGGAGKTSTLRSLLNYTFEENLASTELADVGADVEVRLKDVSVLKWVEVVSKQTEDNHVLSQEFKEYARRLMALNNSRSEILEEVIQAAAVNEDKSELFNDKEKCAELKQDISTTIAELSTDVASPSELQNVEEMTDSMEVHQTSHILQPSAQHERNDASKVVEDALKFTVWDFGGQAVFHSPHHLYLTKGGFYIVVFNASELVENRTRAKERHSLQQWLEAISLNAPDSPAVLVGTRSGRLSTHELEEINSELEMLLDQVKVIPIEPEASELLFFPIENSTANVDSKPIDALKRAIVKLVGAPDNFKVKKTFWNTKIPLSWIYFMQTVLKRNKDRVTLEDFVQYGSSVGFSKPELKSVINFYHEAGAILAFFSSTDGTLGKYIVLQPQWLLKAVSTFLFDPKVHGKKAKKRAGKGWRKEMRLYQKTGILSKSFADHLLSTGGIGDAGTKNFILTQCERLLLISRFPFAADGSQASIEDLSETRWLVPSMNRIAETALSSKPPDQSCFKILIKFKGNMPFGIFERLVCLFLQRNGSIEGSGPPVVHCKNACFFLRKVPVFLTDHNPETPEFQLNVQEFEFGVHLPIVVEILGNILEDLKQSFVGNRVVYEAVVESLRNQNKQGHKYQCNLDALLAARSDQKNFVFLANTYEAVPISFFAHFINPVTTPVQDEPRNAGEWKWDCFLAHEWGETTATGHFETHHKVLRIAEMLRKAGLRVWVDDSYIRDQLSTEMADGILNSACIVTFLTQRYFLRCQDPNTNCARELHNAKLKGAKHLLPVVLDHRVLDTNQWLGTAVSMALPDKLYINFSNEKEISNNFENCCNEIKLRVELPRKKVLLDLDETKA